MTRDEHLVFCKKCLNKRFDTQQGLVCKLTDKIADFDGECENFSQDDTVIEEEVNQNKYTETSSLPSEIKEKLVVHQDLSYALIGGFFISVICAIIWAFITVSTEYQIGYMAIAVGFAVGMGVRYFGAGVDPIYGYLGAFLALVGCLLGNLFTQVGFIAISQSLGYFETLMLIDFDTVILIYEEAFTPMDLVLYGIATYEGYKFAFRKIPENASYLDDFTPAHSNMRLPLIIVCLCGILFTGYSLSKGINGNQTFYYESGEVLSTGEYIEGKESGLWKYYYENGAIQAEAIYMEGVENQIWKWYFESGKLMRQGTYRNGLFEGLWLNFFENGVLSDSSNYSNGRLIGTNKTFYQNGQISQTGEYRRDKQEGLWKVYYDNGNPNAEGKFKNGELIGLWKFWDHKGNLLREFNYEDNNKFKIVNAWNTEGKQIVKNGNGTYSSYSDNGNVIDNGQVKDGEKIGSWKIYYANGKLKEEGKYEGNTYILSMARLDNGEVIVENGAGEYITYYDSSTDIHEKGKFKDGLKDGYWEVYYPSSVIMQQESQYTKGKLNGRSATYYANGNMLASGDFINDKKSGEWVWYYETGLIQCSVNYENDKKVGSQIFWSESGREAKEEIYENGELVSETLR